VQNHVCRKTQNRRPICGVRGPILTACGGFWFDKNRRPNGGIWGPILRDSILQKRIFGSDLLQFYRDYFYYKYRHCISVNPEIEGAETRV